MDRSNHVREGIGRIATNVLRHHLRAFRYTLAESLPGFAAAFLVSCSAPPQADVRPASVAESPSNNASPTGHCVPLHVRAQQLWDARLSEGWANVYLFEDPSIHQHHTPAEFIEWAQKNEPFKVHSFEFTQVLTDSKTGWVEVDCQISMRRFPLLPPQPTHRSEKWRLLDGAWYPVPPRELDHYPDSPLVRDSVEEERLRAQLEASWDARLKGDWMRLYDFTDPRDRSPLAQQQFVDVVSQAKYFSYQIQWIEVIGDRGRVRVSYVVALNDPSLTKLPRQHLASNEEWVKVEDMPGGTFRWRLDLKVQTR